MVRAESPGVRRLMNQRPQPRITLPTYLQETLLIAVLVALALVMAGKLVVPSTSLLSLAAAST